MAVRDFRSRFLNTLVEIVQRLTEGRTGVGRRGLSTARADPCVDQQVADQGLHPLHAIDDVGDIRVGFVVQSIGVLFAEELHEAGHRPQRLLKVMRSHGGELLQIPVRASQFPGRLAQGLLRPLALGNVYSINADSPGLRNIVQRLMVVALAHRYFPGESADVLTACTEKQNRAGQPGMVETTLLKVGKEPLRRRVGERHRARPRLLPQWEWG